MARAKDGGVEIRESERVDGVRRGARARRRRRARESVEAKTEGAERRGIDEAKTDSAETRGIIDDSVDGDETRRET